MSVAGELSETADLSALEKAKAMLESDPNANTVLETGWWLGKDGKWRYEIADNEMRFERNGLYKNPQTLEDYIEHDELFEAYPHLRNIRVEYVDVVNGKPTTRGNYSHEQNRILLKKGMSNNMTKTTLLHEIQHAVQAYEGFAGGSNSDRSYGLLFNLVYRNVKNTQEYNQLKTPDERFEYVDSYFDYLDDDVQRDIAFSLYEKSYGEEEARATASRLEMTKNDRRKSPIQNNGVAYTYESVRSELVDNLKEIGYNETEINEKLSGGVYDDGQREEATRREYGNAAEQHQGQAPRSSFGVTRNGESGKASNEKEIRRDELLTEDASRTRSEEHRSARGKSDSQALRGRLRRVKYSISPETDSDYLSAVENGDMETAQRMVDEAAQTAENIAKMSASGEYVDSIHNDRIIDYNEFDGALSREQWANFYSETDHIIDSGEIQSGENVFFAPKSKHGRATLVIYDYDPNRKNTRKVIAAYRDTSVLNNIIEGIKQEYEQQRDNERLGNEIGERLERKELQQYSTRTLDYSDGNISRRGPKGSAGRYFGDTQNVERRSGVQARDLADRGGVKKRGVKYSISPETDSDYLSADSVTYDDNGNVIPLSERFNEGNEDIRYSISPSLESDIDSVLNGTFDASRNEVYLGETSRFMTDVIGANALLLYMPASKVYSSLVTREEYNKKPYYTEQDNYHGIGKDDFIDILERSENPIAAFAAAPDEKGNKRLNRIVLVTDKIIKDTETGENGYAVVVEEVDTNGLDNGKRVKANKAITVYPRTKLDSDITLAIADGRLLDLSEKGRHLFAGVRGSNPQAAIRKDVFKKNIANFWANVKWNNQKNKIYSSSVTPTTTAMEDAIKNSSYYKSMQNSENDADGRMSVSEAIETDGPSYDNNGKVIPLSERFNAENEDIRYSVTISDLENEYGVNIDTEIADLYSTKDYNNFGWARVNNMLSSGENEEFKRRLQDKSKYGKTLKGEYMIPVGDYGDVERGADNVIVFTKGSFDNPVITQVVRINLDNDTECSYVREELVNNLSKGARYDTIRNIIEKTYGKELLARYTRDGAPSLREIRQANNTEGSGADNRGISVGEGSNTDASSKIPGAEEAKYSVSVVTETDEPSYNELKRQLDKLQKRNAKLAHEVIRTHGKEVDPKSATALLKDIIEKYQGTIKAKDILARFEEVYKYANTKGANVDELMIK